MAAMRESASPRRAIIILLGELAILLLLAAVPDFSSSAGDQGPRCYAQNREDCLKPQTELESISVDTCGGRGPRVCLVPLGTIDAELVGHLVAYYQAEYDLQVSVLTPSPIPKDINDPDREQVGGIALIGYMNTLFPDAYPDPDAILIGLTPVDMYIEHSDWRFAFWVSNQGTNKGVISSFRMNPATFGKEPDDELFHTRVRKVVTWHIGTLYYDLPLSDDPRSVLYNNVLDLGDLDLMAEELPMGVRR
jgi:predicted Zn-dependent protease